MARWAIIIAELLVAVTWLLWLWFGKEAQEERREKQRLKERASYDPSGHVGVLTPDTDNQSVTDWEKEGWFE